MLKILLQTVKRKNGYALCQVVKNLWTLLTGCTWRRWNIGQQWTWTNNWKEEGYIEARLDRFFGASQWLLENGKARVQHIDRQASDHCMILLDTSPERGKKKGRFCFDKRWLTKPGLEEVIRATWEQESFGSPMHIVACKIKQCKLAIMEWNRISQHNSAKRIVEIKVEMEKMRAEGGDGGDGRA